MKKLLAAGILASGFLYMTGCGSHKSSEVSPALMEALKNPKTDELAGEEGLYITFVQSRDGKTMMNDVEALDTLYLLSAVGTTQTHVYETDKNVNVLSDNVVNDVWGETRLYRPAALPDIDFEKAYSAVKKIAGEKPIANIAIFYTLEENELRVSFTLEGKTPDLCDQYQYIVASDDAFAATNNVKCFFENEGNTTEEPLGSEGFTGSTFSFILEGLADGMLSATGEDIMGNFLSLLGWGDSGNNAEEQTLKDIDGKLTQIGNELTEIEGELQAVLTDIKVSEDSIKNDVDWPRDAVTAIHTATQSMQLLGSDTKPGEGNRTKIKNLASDILGAQYDIPNQVMSIYTAIEGNPTPLLSNYVDQVMLQLGYNDNSNLQKAYQGFEYYTSELLNNQIKGVNLVVEAHKAQDDNSSAQKYLECYDSNASGDSECNLLYKEIGDMDNPNSFIYNAVSMVLRDAPIYDPFLPSSAESIFKRAEFYRLLTTGTDVKKFGLRIFHISTADMDKSPDTYYVAKNREQLFHCSATRHTIRGRMYDFWEDDKTVKPSSDYNVVEYDCGSVPNGKYDIYLSDDNSEKSIATATVAQYKSDYTQSSDGNISYGFALLTKNIPNRFTESSNKWSIQKPGKDNYHSSTSGSANDWPIKAYASSERYYESKARIELDGHFHYGGEDEKKMYIDYYAKFYTKADAPFVFDIGGGDAYSYYYVGVYDKTEGGYASANCKNKTYYRLHASSTHHYSSHHDVKAYCSFTAKPGHDYYIYFNMKADQSSTNWFTVAESELDTVYRVYVMFTY